MVIINAIFELDNVKDQNTRKRSMILFLNSYFEDLITYKNINNKRKRRQ